ncbi:MAG: tRNA glutamyl-Q(34) synthetase GluQRS [Planctomycetes bacterium]|nr:tRNA glutamyl-Q(34) synthetase GluQRS [Planctomycetota bacterium]
MTPLGRLAPTPSGLLHLGNARSFLLAWLWARGNVLLRIEDIDKPRCKPEFTNAAIEDLNWLALVKTGVTPESSQSTRTDLYRKHLKLLAQQGRAYPCSCTRRDIEEASSAPHGDEGPIYPGTCRGKWRDAAHAKAETGREPAWRFLWEEPPVAFHDEVAGDVTVDPSTLGDFVLWRRDDLPSYQLAVALDDALQGVTQVLRGRDLLLSTARQMAIQRALGLPSPAAWAHVPFIQEATGRRMAKRDGDLSLKALREQGVDARRVTGVLAWSAGLIGKPESATVNELVGEFNLRKLSREDFVLRDNHLGWLLHGSAM